MGSQPHYRIIKKSADGKKWETIGAGWDRDSGEGYSLSFEPNGRAGDKIKCLMVKNTPKEQAPTPGATPPGPDPEPPSLPDDSIPF